MTIQFSLSDLPSSGPAIYGLKSVYSEGEFVNLTCESGPSSPVTSLSWYLNSVRVNEASPLVSQMAPLYPLPDRRAISRSSISVLLSGEMFYRSLEVSCEASVGSLYSQSAVVRVGLGHSWRDWAQHFSGSPVLYTSNLLLLSLASGLCLK